MRKGFSVTLAMVAFAMLAMNARAYAPVIQEIPDIIVGDAENSSASNVFVFPDAIDLDAKVSDDLTTDSGIIWTYSETTDNMYTINKALRSDPAVDNLVSPSAAKKITTTWDPRDTVKTVAGARTVTIRDESRSPVASDNGVDTTYSPADCDGSSTQAYKSSRTITLYASDGSTVSLANAQSFIVYTLDNGLDTYSPLEDVVYNPMIVGQTGGFAYATSAGAASQSSGASGLCITVGATGDNDANWHSPYGVVTLTANSVWEARLTVTTSQTTVGASPLWCLVYDNYGGTSPNTGQNEFGGEYFFMDNEGGAVSAIAGAGRTGSENFRVWMMPAPEQTAQFASSTSGFLRPALDANNDMRIILRVMDYGSASYGAASDSGSICWSGVKVVKHDLADMVVDSTDMSVTSFVSAQSLTAPMSTNAWYADGLNTAGFNPTTLTFGTTAVSIAPTTNWNTATVIVFHPGNNTVNLSGVGSVAENVDNWPITWLADSLYYIEFTLASPSSAAEIDPPDVIRLAADAETSEIIFDSYIVPNTPDDPFSTRGVSMPRTGTAQKYACFFYTHSVTKSGISDSKRWRPRLDVLCSSTITPIGRPNNTGGILVTGMKVQKVHFTQ